MTSAFEQLRARLTRASALAQTKSPARVAVEIDGRAVRVLDLRRGTASMTEYRGDPTTILAGLGKKIPKGTPVTFAAADIDVCQGDAPPAGDDYLPAVVIDEALRAKANAADGSLVAAGRKRPGTRQLGVVSLPSEAVAALWPIVRSLGAHVTTPAVTYAAIGGTASYAADGLFLAVHESTTNLLYVNKGIPVEGRDLRCDPMAAVAAQLGADSDSNWIAYVNAALQQGDERAAAAVLPWINQLVTDVQRVTDQWRSDYALPSTVFLVGPGATLAPLPQALLDVAGMNAAAPSIPAAVDFSGRTGEEAARAWTCAAAIAATAENKPYLFFVDPEEPDLRRRAAARQHRQRVGVVVGACVLVIGGSWAANASAHRSLDEAKTRLVAAQSEVQKLQPTANRVARVEKAEQTMANVAKADPKWALVLNELHDSAPAGTEFTRLSVQSSSDGIQVNANAVVPSLDFAVVAAWMRRIQDLGAPPVVPESFQNQPGSGNSEVLLRFTLPQSAGKPPVTTTTTAATAATTATSTASTVAAVPTTTATTADVHNRAGR